MPLQRCLEEQPETSAAYCIHSSAYEVKVWNHDAVVWKKTANLILPTVSVQAFDSWERET